MIKNILRLRALIILCLVLALACSEAYAWGGGHGGRGYHYYSGGNWYRHGWFWFDTAVTALTIGALIDSLPPRYTTVVYAGAPYYYADGYYFRPYPYGGYVVVQPPTIVQPVLEAPAPVAPPAPAQAAQIPDTVTINIPDGKGGYTPVTLKRAGSGYIGPQGEYYSDHPTVEQLKTLYGGK